MILTLPFRIATVFGLLLYSGFSDSALAQDSGPSALLQVAPSSDGDEVGRAVVMNQSTLFAGAPGFIGPNQRSQGQVFTWTQGVGSGWTPGPAIAPPNPNDAEFGQSMALSTSTLIVGAPASASTRPSTGAVEVFGRFDGQSWKPLARIFAQDAQPGDAFGSAVAIDGNTLVVGAKGESSQGPSSGAVYLFERAYQTQSWVQVAKLVAPNGKGLDYFGSAVAIHNRQLAIGAPGQDGLQPPGAPIPATDAGRVYLYEKIDGRWVLQDQLVIADPGPGDALGTSLQIDENTVIAGAPGVDTLRPGQTPPFVANTGAVFTFRNINGRWRQTQILSPPEKRSNEFMGTSIALNQERLLVGSQYNPYGDPETGKALLWTRQGDQGSWSLSAELSPSGSKDVWGHGNAVYLSKNQAAVGAPLATKSGPSQEEAGAVSVYRIPGATAAPVLGAPLHWLSLLVMTGWLYRRRSA